MRKLMIAVTTAAALGGGACGRPPDTPLTIAAQAGHLDQVRALLARGEAANQADGRGITPLIRAARTGHTEVVGALLQAGADPNLRDAAGNRWTPLVHAIHKHQNQAARLLLEAGADVEAAEGGGATPLIFAAAYGNAEMVRELLARGADPTVKTTGGVTALGNAMGEGGWFDITDGPAIGTCHPEVVRALLQKAPDLRLEAGQASRIARWFGSRKGCAEAAALLHQPAAS